jgi:integrase
MTGISYRKVQRKKSRNGYVWQYSFDVLPQSGKRKRISKSGFMTKKECMEAAIKAKEQYDRTGNVLKDVRISYSDILDKFLKESEKNVQETTLEGYEKKIRNLIRPRLGSYDVKAITKQTVKDFIHELYLEDYSQTTLQNTKGIIVKSLDYAIDTRYITENPALNVSLPNEFIVEKEKHDNSSGPVRGDKKREYITDEEFQKIMERYPEGTNGHVALILAYRCGLRLGETFGLTWDDINLEKRRLEVNRQVQWKASKKTIKGHDRRNKKPKGYWYYKPPKYSSYRTIYLDEHTAELLAREKQIQAKDRENLGEHYVRYYTEKELAFGGVRPDVFVRSNRIYPESYKDVLPEGVFYEVDPVLRYTSETYRLVYNRWHDEMKKTKDPTAPGTWIDARKLQYISEVIHKKLGIENFEYHALRHAHVVKLRENHLSDVFIQKRLGHKRISTTLNVYANHLTPKMIEDATNELNKIY